MAVANALVQMFNTLGLIVKWGWWVFVLGAMFIAKKKWSAYPIDVVIIEKRGENLIKTNERAGRKYDKETAVTYYQLQKSKETMPVYNFEWMMHNVNKPTNLLEKLISILRPTIGTVFLFKYGSKQYKPINVKENKNTENILKLKELKNKDGTSLYKYEYNQFDPRWVLDELDFEVIDWDNMNFMVQEQRASMMRRTTGMAWMKQLAVPAMIIAGSVIASLFIMKFSADAGAALRTAGGVAAQANVTTHSNFIGGAINGALAPGS